MSAAQNLTGERLAIMAFTAGAAVSNVYFNQPLLELIGNDLAIDQAKLGLVPAVTLGGLALGTLLLIPLGDRFDRKRLVLAKLAVTIVSLGLAAFAPNLPLLLLAGFGIGLSSTVAQQLVPFASSIAPDGSRGRYVGTVVSTIMLGILLGRTVGGLAGELYGWRCVYGAAAAVMVGVALVTAARLPNSRPTTQLNYARLLASILSLIREHRILREAMFTQALIWAAFNAFWATFAALLAGEPYHLGSTWAGSFGLVGAVGAFAAAAAGRLSDRIGSRGVVGVATAVVLLSYLLLFLGGRSFAALVAGVIVLDLGVQSALVANQTRAFALAPAAQNRINTVFMTIMFIGGAFGAGSGAWFSAAYGWTGVALLGAAFAALAGLVHAAHWGALQENVRAR
jgi:predicted MFS family arabinose efflux permease